jgi:hypothetical protein
MTKRTALAWILAVVLVAMLGGAYSIVINSSRENPIERDTPAGFFH